MGRVRQTLENVAIALGFVIALGALGFAKDVAKETMNRLYHEKSQRTEWNYRVTDIPYHIESRAFYK